MDYIGCEVIVVVFVVVVVVVVVAMVVVVVIVVVGAAERLDDRADRPPLHLPGWLAPAAGRPHHAVGGVRVLLRERLHRHVAGVVTTFP